MSDIVEMLREFATDYTTTTYHDELIREAADEIERLRGLSDITRLDVMWQELVKERYAAENNAVVLAAEVKNLRAEIERLRGLLRYAVPAGDASKDWYKCVREALGDE